MIKIEKLHPLLKSVAESPDGVTPIELAKKLTESTRKYHYEQSVSYDLRLAEKDGFVQRVGKKYVLTDHVFIQNGFGIIYDEKYKQFSFIGCPHYGSCPCSGVITEDCGLLKDLRTMPIVKKFLSTRKSKTQKK